MMGTLLNWPFLRMATGSSGRKGSLQKPASVTGIHAFGHRRCSDRSRKDSATRTMSSALVVIN